MSSRILSLIVLLSLAASPVQLPQQAPATIAAPILKWSEGGCGSWCQTGWYSSPAVADLDGDGTPEVIGSGYSISVVDGSTGALEWQVASGYDRSSPGASPVGRTWPGIVAADIDADSHFEIVTAHSGGWVSVYDQAGYFQPGWPQHPTSNELRGLTVYDLDSDGTAEIIVTGATYNRTNTWVYEHTGQLRPGWPQLDNDSGYAHGVFNDNSSAGELNGQAAIVVPSDVHYIAAYTPDGIMLPANPVYGGKTWGLVGVWESYATELRGWGTCTVGDSRAERYRANFADGASVIADMDGDAVNEVVVTGNMYDCINGYPSRYIAPFIFNADRSRYANPPYDWHTNPLDTGAPRMENYNVIETVEPNPVTADLDGDGQLELLFASYDGRLHAYWLDKTEHHQWPYDLATLGGGSIRFASEPLVADLDNDGKAEVLFSSWVQKGSGLSGFIHILNDRGEPLHTVPLPVDDGGDWNGGLPAPTLANIDAAPDLELVVNTAATGLVAYDLPGTAQARVQWGTGRWNFQRSASQLTGMLSQVNVGVNSPVAQPGEVLTYTVRLTSRGPAIQGVMLDHPLPPNVTRSGTPSASAGSFSMQGNTLHWEGSLSPTQPVTIQFSLLVSPGAVDGMRISTAIEVNDGNGGPLLRQTTSIVGGYSYALPLIRSR